MPQSKGFLTMNEIVKYDNFLNSLSLKNFTGTELDMLMTLCQRARDKECDVVQLDFAEMQGLMNLQKNMTAKQFEAALDKMNEKLNKVSCHIKTETKSIRFVLFPTFEADYQERRLRVRVNQDFRFVLNALTKNFTRFELTEFTALDSKYAKNLYRLLKQYRRTGTYKKSVEELRELMDCPKSYKNGIFMRDCLNPAIEELKQTGYFQELKVEAVRGHRRGAPVTHYIITFKPDDQIPGQLKLDDVGVHAPEAKGKRQAKKNSFNDFQQNEYDFDALERELTAGQ